MQELHLSHEGPLSASLHCLLHISAGRRNERLSDHHMHLCDVKSNDASTSAMSAQTHYLHCTSELKARCKWSHQGTTNDLLQFAHIYRLPIILLEVLQEA